MCALIPIALAAAALVLPGLDHRLLLRRYAVEAPGLTGPVRLALLADLHSCRWGRGQEGAIRLLEEARPDAVLLTGDIFDDRADPAGAETLLRAVGERWPSWYVTGNHEYYKTGGKAFRRKMRLVRECGVRRLSGEAEVLAVRGERIALCGVDDPCAHGSDKDKKVARQLERARKAAPEGLYTVLLAHRPELADQYARAGFDLALCGHAHGGQWRIPGLVNGLYAPGQGAFPRFAGGMYRADGMTLVVSRGMARWSPRVPRWYDRPEVVIVELRPNAPDRA